MRINPVSSSNSPELSSRTECTVVMEGRGEKKGGGGGGYVGYVCLCVCVEGGGGRGLLISCTCRLFCIDLLGEGGWKRGVSPGFVICVRSATDSFWDPAWVLSSWRFKSIIL